jgi:hypothetical protein
MLYLENHFPMEMNPVKQIEMIPGPSSALYGSHAMFATIRRMKWDRFSGIAETGSFGEKKADRGGWIPWQRQTVCSRDRRSTIPVKVHCFFRSSTRLKTTTERRSIGRARKAAISSRRCSRHEVKAAFSGPEQDSADILGLHNLQRPGERKITLSAGCFNIKTRLEIRERERLEFERNGRPRDFALEAGASYWF